MNRYQFEEVLFEAMYAPMRAAWNRMESDGLNVGINDVESEDVGTDSIEVEDEFDTDAGLAYADCLLPLDC